MQAQHLVPQQADQCDQGAGQHAQSTALCNAGRHVQADREPACNGSIVLLFVPDWLAMHNPDPPVLTSASSMLCVVRMMPLLSLAAFTTSHRLRRLAGSRPCTMSDMPCTHKSCTAKSLRSMKHNFASWLASVWQKQRHLSSYKSWWNSECPAYNCWTAQSFLNWQRDPTPDMLNLRRAGRLHTPCWAHPGTPQLGCP